MKRRHCSIRRNQPLSRLHDAGITSLPEVMIAAATMAMVVGASALGLRSTETLISQSGDKATLRQNTVNGLRLMRSEVERSIHLVVDNKSGFSENQQHLNLLSTRYKDTRNECQRLSGGNEFKPIFAA